MELLFAAIALPCLAFAMCEYFRGYFTAKELHNNTNWTPRKDDKEYDNL